MPTLKYRDPTDGTFKVVPGGSSSGGTIAGSVPIGTITSYAGDTAPDGWLLCDGQAVSRTTYASLFAAIGDTYGAGDGSTTFDLPNLKGRTAFGVDAAQTEFATLGRTGGGKTLFARAVAIIMATQNFLEQRITVPAWNATHVHDFPAQGVVATVEQTLGVSVGSVEDPSTSLPPYVALNFIIKVTEVAAPGGISAAEAKQYVDENVVSVAVPLNGDWVTSWDGLVLRRSGSVVELIVSDLSKSTATTFLEEIALFPEGYRPTAAMTGKVQTWNAYAGLGKGALVITAEGLYADNPPDVNTFRHYGTTAWVTDDPWPTGATSLALPTPPKFPWQTGTEG